MIEHRRIPQPQTQHGAGHTMEGLRMIDRATIHDATAFDNGDLFASDAQVRAYFTAGNVEAMFGECPQTQGELTEMADAVIEHRWHMADGLTCSVCDRAGIVSAATHMVTWSETGATERICPACAAEVGDAGTVQKIEEASR